MSESENVATVLFDFSAEEEDELSVRRGELVDFVDEQNQEGGEWVWVRSQASGEDGQVPAEYIAKGDILPLPDLPASPKEDASPPAADHEQAQEAPDIVEEEKEEEKTEDVGEADEVADNFDDDVFELEDEEGEEGDLPEGWTEHIDDVTRRPFYYNEDTGESRWERPERTSEDAASPMESPGGATRRKSEALVKKLSELDEIMAAKSQRAGTYDDQEAADDDVGPASEWRPAQQAGEDPYPPRHRVSDAAPRSETEDQPGGFVDDLTQQAGTEAPFEYLEDEDATEARIRLLEAEAAALRAEREAKASEKKEAATRLQATWRGHRGRNSKRRLSAIEQGQMIGSEAEQEYPPAEDFQVQHRGSGLDEDTVNVIAEMVESRLLKELQRRDIALQGLETAVEELRGDVHHVQRLCNRRGRHKSDRGHGRRRNQHASDDATPSTKDASPFFPDSDGMSNGSPSDSADDAATASRKLRAGNRLPSPGFSQRAKSEVSSLSKIRRPGAAKASDVPKEAKPSTASRSPSPRLPRLSRSSRDANAKGSSVRMKAGNVGVKYSPCRSTVYPPSTMSKAEQSSLENAPVPSKELALDYIHGYNGGYGANVAWLKSSELVFPAGAAVVMLNYTTNKQRFFLGHDAEVGTICVHPEYDIVASGQNSRVARVCVFEVSQLMAESHSRPGRGIREPSTAQDVGAGRGVGVGQPGVAGIRLLSQFFLGKTSRGVATCDFSPDGHLLLAVCKDDHHSASVLDWRSGSVLAVARVNSAEVWSMRWNPEAFNGVDEAPSTPCYSIVSGGVRHVKFWTLEKRDGDSSALPPSVRGISFCQDRGRGKNEAATEALRLSPSVRESLSSGSWALRGMQGSFARFDVVDATCVAFARENSETQSGASRVLIGTSAGSIMCWVQNASGDGAWLPKGRATACVQNVHSGRVYDIAVSIKSENETCLVSAGQDGRVVVSALKMSSSGGKDSSLAIDAWRLAYTAAIGVGAGLPGALSLEESGTLLVVGTTGNALCLYDLETEIAPTSDAILPEDAKVPMMEEHLLLQGHASSCRSIACHPKSRRFVTCSADRTLRLWDAEGRRLQSTARLSAKTTAVAFGPEGQHVAAGTEAGDVVVLEYVDGDGGRWEVVAHKTFAKKNRSRSREQDTTDDESGDAGSDSLKAAAIVDLKYSPDGSVLAVASRDGKIHLLSAAEAYRRTASCTGHSSVVTSLDFSEDGTTLRSNDAAREILNWDVPSGAQIPDAFGLRDTAWHTWTCELGWPVQGIWQVPAEKRPLASSSPVDRPSEVLSLCASHQRDILAMSDDASRIRLFCYPCLKGAKATAPAYAHAGKVSCVRFTADDEVLLSCGAQDACVMQWRVERVTGAETTSSMGRPSRPSRTVRR